ncbi:type II toxin-antitoxin system RelE/ParE family toxin [Fibrella sp. HMF5335]|uniref:Type II toxin-antitoxin system RelE/ParE family toxin n=1 Tax=Fibrella rubiginis TaxID=2817060 RepID=A0A939K3G5_9BACT|nr:type II toxin-antitoxin system RelE/ParE family toxin [Fibrella rubiginis]MBO0935618.1 type II toxin-antitoxin system RelE/ParE family toxin [Fibrella rubiginis]
MEITFANNQLKDWVTMEYEGRQPFAEPVLKAYRKTIAKLEAAASTTALRQNKSLDFHPLKRDLVGKYAVRVNMQYRVVFSIDKQTGAAEILHIEQLTDYH